MRLVTFMLSLAPILLYLNLCGSPPPERVNWDAIAERVQPNETPQWSPDGQYIATAVHPNGENGTIEVVRVDGSQSHRFYQGNDAGEIDISPDISPDGTRLVYANRTHTQKVRCCDYFQLITSRPDGSDKRKLTATYSDDFPNGDEFAPRWSPDGSHIAYLLLSGGVPGSGASDGIYIAKANGETVSRVARIGREYWGATHIKKVTGGPVWSPDGRKLALVSEVWNRRHLYVLELDSSLSSGRLRRLIDGADYDEYHTMVGPPAWSPDGTRLAFLQLRKGGRGPQFGLQLYTVNADGSGLRKVITVEDVKGDRGTEAVVEWSPDGVEILFSWSIANKYAGRSGGAAVGSIYVVHANWSNLREIGTGTYASWSPDGSRIAVTHHEYNGAVHGLSTMAPDGSDVRILLKGTSR